MRLKEIKTHHIHKNIKALNKSITTAEYMKWGYTRKNLNVKKKQSQEHATVVEYAGEKIENAEDISVHELAHQIRKKESKFAHMLKEKHRVSRESKQIKQQIKEKHSAPSDSFSAGREGYSYQLEEPIKKRVEVQRNAAQTKKFQEQTIKTIKHDEKTIKAIGKGTIKTAGKSIKTAEHSSKTAIKTTEQIEKNAMAAAKASAIAAQKSAQTAHAMTKTTATVIKAAIKATIAAVKAIISGTKSLISAIAVGGWVAVVVILLICMIGLLLSSVFGIFFSGESSGDSQPTMQTIIAEINTEYQSKLDKIKSNTSYDVLEMSGSKAVWKEVLAIYAIKTNTDPDNPQEVVTIDDNKKHLLKDIFWEMNTISSSTNSVTETIKEESDDSHGNIVTEEKKVTRRYLYIAVSHKNADEMAKQYGFNNEQKAQLYELLLEEYASLWDSVLYGITTSDGKIAAIAATQIGNISGEPYWSWYGFGSRVEWCACFVSWCANQCGYIDNGIIPKFSLCSDGVAWFKSREQFKDRNYTPNEGDIIFFDWDADGETDHVGIVEKLEENIIYTIEGNSEDSCKRNSYTMNSVFIYGYGIPAY